jgi:hypothetical protein
MTEDKAVKRNYGLGGGHVVTFHDAKLALHCRPTDQNVGLWDMKGSEICELVER